MGRLVQREAGTFADHGYLESDRSSTVWTHLDNQFGLIQPQ